ncbi:helix-turn-helix domain-containing protein [Cupriavidus sp. AU9028]|uniref:helix-turn-helix domain-containing protein n=1 Tax=Cupriavidus sp. AU9028 TaxID=2871157 RepID=UPI001C97B639|nr:helix-turn-helix domain-containing protein [Cupriavidus sp. AU9028]MBY4897801.1 helix-turn-helix domain-containing protein [Cupriavidus sp. AU9028]
MSDAPSSIRSGEFPVFETSDFAGEGSFFFDLVRLEDRDDIPRGFLHRHNYYHLLWMTRASGTHMLDFAHLEVRDHSVFFLSPGQVHAWTSSVKPHGYVLNFSTDFFARMFPRADDVARVPFYDPMRGNSCLYLSQDRHDDMLPLLAEMEREVRDRQPGYRDVVQACLLILLTRLGRLCPDREPSGGAGPHQTLARRFFMLVDSHYLRFETVGQYAEALCVSERQLNDAVKRAMGRTASQVVQERVVLEAKRWLSNTELGIGEIAYRLNIDDPAYFARFFKKQTGLTPGDFRRQHCRPLE